MVFRPDFPSDFPVLISRPDFASRLRLLLYLLALCLASPPALLPGAHQRDA
jgi:hypothetical protein